MIMKVTKKVIAMEENIRYLNENWFHFNGVLNQFAIVIHEYIFQIDFFHRKSTFIFQIGLNVISAL